MSDSLDALSGVETPSLKDVWQWVVDTFTPEYRSEVEAYLADSFDIYDLERRIVLLQKRGMI
jgi:hypothetical protein